MQRPVYFLCIFLCVFCIVGGLLFSPQTHADGVQPSSQLQVLFEQGREYYLDKQFSQAETLFKQCVDLEPKNAEYICWLAQSMSYLLAEKAMRGASKLTLMPGGKSIRDLYFKAVEIDPRSERARQGYAILMRDIPGWLGGDVDKAEKMFLTLLEENPHNVFAMHHLGNLYIRNRKDYETGISYLKKAVAETDLRTLSPEEEMLLANTNHALGKVYKENLDDNQTAISYFEKSLAKNDSSIVTMLDMIDAYQSLKQIDQARTVFHKALEIAQERKYKRFKGEIKSAAKKLGIKEKINL